MQEKKVKHNFKGVPSKNNNTKNNDETKENLKQCLSIDSTAITTTSMGMNEEMFHSKEHAEDEPGTIGNSGIFGVNETRTLDGFSGVSFNEDDIFNSLAFIDVMNAGFGITMDAQEETAFL